MSHWVWTQCRNDAPFRIEEVQELTPFKQEDTSGDAVQLYLYGEPLERSSKSVKTYTNNNTPCNGTSTLGINKLWVSHISMT